MAENHCCMVDDDKDDNRFAKQSTENRIMYYATTDESPPHSGNRDEDDSSADQKPKATSQSQLQPQAAAPPQIRNRFSRARVHNDVGALREDGSTTNQYETENYQELDMSDVTNEGCWGSAVAQHQDELDELDQSFYDDRYDADDDIQKGHIKFSTSKLYGRENELKKLRELYGQVLISSSPYDTNGDARVVFVGGYSGVGKTAVVAELVRQVRYDYGHDSHVFCAHGKYSKLQSASIPFSAIGDSLGQLVGELASDGYHEEVLDDIRHKLRRDYDGSDMEQIMRIIFPPTAPLFYTNKAEASVKSESSMVAPNMNEVKRAFKDCLNAICSCLHSPLIWFIDDCQWSDEASLVLLRDVLLSSRELTNVLFIASYRSNEVNEDHPFHELMIDAEKSSSTAVAANANANDNNVERVDLFGLSPDAIGEFVSDTLGKEGGAAEVSTLTEVIYAKTLGNIFFVKQALEELVRKNALFYDLVMFSWQYNITQVQLENYLSDDLIEMVQSKIEDQPREVKKLVVIMSLVPNNATLSTMMALLECEGVNRFKVQKLIQYATKQGMIIHKKECDKHAFTHDKIREASFDIIPQGRPRDELLVRISRVLIDLAGSEGDNEWAFFVAVDHMNSVLPELVPRGELSRLNYRVGEMNLAKGATLSANTSLLAALSCLTQDDPSGSDKWKDEYQFTLQLLNRVIVSEFSMGKFEMAFLHVQDVLENATSLDDKFTAYLYRMKTMAEGENRDYDIGIAEGLKVCEVYGIKFAKNNPPKKSDLMKESVQLKAALHNRPLTVLAGLPLAKDSSIFLLLRELLTYANLAGSQDLAAIIAERAIQLALQKGLSRELMSILSERAGSLSKDLGKLKTANKFAMAAEDMARVFRGDKALYAETRFRLMATIFVLLRPFRDCLDAALDSYRPLLNAGRTNFGLGAALSYSYMYLDAGLPLNSPLIEPKIILFGESCRPLQMHSFEVFFASYRQMLHNLRKQKKGWTTLKGDAFDEDAALRSVEGTARATTLRDTSTFRLFLAFIFWDEECMASMLDNLAEFTDPDIIWGRTCLRLCFIGLAAFTMGRNKLANKCLGYFKSLSKLGSPNATPIYHFMKATASPSRVKYDEAISHCEEARMVHLTAMANERCGAFLSDLGNDDNDDASKEYIVAAYWMYHDWGASSKTNNMLERHSFLKEAIKGYRKAPSEISADMRLANRTGVELKPKG